MRELKSEIDCCRRCGLSQTRRQAIFGEGNPDAEIMLIGEAPGADEDRVGRPFIGKSGQLLDRILAACEFTRETHVFITNSPQTVTIHLLSQQKSPSPSIHPHLLPHIFRPNLTNRHIYLLYGSYSGIFFT